VTVEWPWGGVEKAPIEQLARLDIPRGAVAESGMAMVVMAATEVMPAGWRSLATDAAAAAATAADTEPLAV